MVVPQTIYVALLNEGTDVWRPVDAVLQINGSYRVGGLMPENERWQFGPGTFVRCETKQFQDGSRKLVAVAGA